MTTPATVLPRTLAATGAEGIQSDPDFDRALEAWASPFLLSGDLATLGQGLLEVPPTRVERDAAQILLARVDSWNGHAERACARLKKILGRTPANTDVLLLLAHIAISRADFVESEATLKRVMASSKSMASSHLSDTVNHDLSALQDIRTFRDLQPITTDKHRRLVIAASLKNEADNIFEWICFHSLVGVQHFFLYLNDCTDETLAEIRRFPNQTVITIHSVEGEFGQRRALQHFIATYGNQVDWVAMIDGDEYLYPAEGDSLIPTIDGLERTGASGIAVNWLNFGSNGHERKPAELCIEAFTRRAPDTFSDHYVIKSICKPANIVRYPHPHHCVVVGGYVLTDGTPVDPVMGRVPRISSTGIRLNHYFTKSKEQLLAKKARGRPLGKNDTARFRDIQFFNLRDRNDVEDLSIQRFVEPTRRMMNSLNQYPKDIAADSRDELSLRRFIERDCGLELWSADRVLDLYDTLQQAHPLFPQQAGRSFNVFEETLRTRLTHQCLDKLKLDSFTAHPAVLLLLHRLIEWLSPALYVELGSGVSSLIAADGLKQFCPGGVGVSVEENAEHLAIVSAGMSGAGIADQLRFVHAPIEKMSIHGETTNWYDNSTVCESLSGSGLRKALIFADGPSTANGWNTRLAAPLILRTHVEPGSVLLLDDAFRSWELRILQKWAAEPGIRVLGVAPVGRGVGVIVFDK